MIDVNALIGSHDLLLVTLDTLRYDVAMRALHQGLTPNLQRILPGGTWEKRQTLGAFTYAAHHAFLAGFLPVPCAPGLHPRLFAADFPGSETVVPQTFSFPEATLPQALHRRGYHTVCIGGVGFFNKRSALGCVLPDLFRESHWAPELGVTDPHSTENQVALACQILARLPAERRLFLFVNVSALHQPTTIFAPEHPQESPETQLAALAYVDRHLPRLFERMQARAHALCIVCSDHGTAFGDDGYTGHRHAHPVVWTVPYAELVL